MNRFILTDPLNKESQTFFERRASEAGWSGALFGCPNCAAINPSGMLRCLACLAPFLFRHNNYYPSYITCPIGNKVMKDVAARVGSE